MKLLILIARRHFSSGHNLSFISLVSYLSIAGLAIGIAVLILTLGILHGFEREVQEKIISFDGHIRVKGFLGNPVAESQPKLDSLVAVTPQISGRLSYINHAATARVRRRTEAVFVEAFDGEASRSVIGTWKNLVSGRFYLDEADGRRPGIVIGRALADKLVSKIGDRMILMDLFSIGKPGRAPRIGQFEISGIYETGLNEYDESIVYINLSAAQRLFNYKDLVTGEILTLEGLDNTDTVADVLDESLDYPLVPSTWKERHRNLFTWLSLQKYPITVVFALVALVAVLNIMSSLTMIVMEKTKDIGVLRAVGFSRKRISRLFFVEGAIVGFFGVILGVSFALLLGWLQKSFNLLSIPEEVYFMSDLPIEFTPSHILTVSAFGVLAAVMASSYPAWKASGIEPAKAVRYE
ncbi:MAG: ABC transporter permease [Candidatus Neomarinimicrobiota bacterium]|nr:ABC transporter permease [Candidatus Neomarinimicrobiota bacterium]